MDAPLMFEVLLYLNSYYFGVFAGSEMLITFAKFNSPTFYTPNIHIDGGVVGLILVSEFIKIMTFQKIREQNRKGLSNFLAITLTLVTIMCLVYVFMIQQPVLKIEYMVCGIMLILMLTEFAFGFLQFLPCCKKKQYVE